MKKPKRKYLYLNCYWQRDNDNEKWKTKCVDFMVAEKGRKNKEFVQRNRFKKLITDEQLRELPLKTFFPMNLED